MVNTVFPGKPDSAREGLIFLVHDCAHVIEVHSHLISLAARLPPDRTDDFCLNYYGRSWHGFFCGLHPQSPKCDAWCQNERNDQRGRYSDRRDQSSLINCFVTSGLLCIIRRPRSNKNTLNWTSVMNPRRPYAMGHTGKKERSLPEILARQMAVPARPL
jgi:hypothetical protein